VRALAAAAAALLLAVALLAAAVAPAAAGGSGGCNPYVNGTIVPVPCSSGSGSGGSGGGGGSSGHGGPVAINNTCTTTPLDKAQAQNLGLSWPPPKGQEWALMDCLGGKTGPGPQAVLVNIATGAPEVTPQQLLDTALGELQIPYFGPHTAPPRGHDALVGLPEWFWIPAGDWKSRSVTVTAGPVWATATATPVGLTFEPGGGLGAVSCAGPGTPYNRAKAASAQHTACSYTYQQPSAGQPGNAYQASVTVTWRVSWTGSGGAGGVLDAGLAVPVAFVLPVAQGEALVNSP
jgi:hypothetical protein